MKKKHEGITQAIRNAGFSVNRKIMQVKNISSIIKVNCYEIPHYA